MSTLMVNLEKRRETAKGRVIKLSNTPFGFFDLEVYQYFAQFGRIKRVRVPRSKKGNFKNVAYVYFCEADVAKVAAQSMDNYLMFEKRVRSRVLTDKIPPSILMGPRLIRNHPLPDRAQKEFAKRVSEKKEDEEVEIFKQKLATSLDKALEKLKNAGYKYKFEFRHKLEEA